MDLSYKSIKDGESSDTNDQATSNSSLQGQISTPDFLHAIHEPAVLPHAVCLKESAIGVLMRNLSVENSLVKNARVGKKQVLENVIKI